MKDYTFKGVKESVVVNEASETSKKNITDKNIFFLAVGNIKFQSAKSSGDFSKVSNWQIKLSDIEGKPRIYDT